VPSERDAVKVGLVVVALYIIGPPMMFFPAIAATQFIPDLQDAGQIYPLLCTKLLPAGMMGLALAAMFSATMSTLSGDFNVCASVLTNDVYKRLCRPGASQKELVLTGRMMTAAIGLTTLAVAFAMSGGKTENMFRIMMTLFGVAASPVAVPMLLGLVSKRYTNQNAMAGFVCGLAVGLALFALSRIKEVTAFGPLQWIPDKEEILFGAFAMKMEIVMFLSTSLTTWGVMEATSRLFPASSDARERIEAFYQRLQTPIGDLPEDRAHGEQGTPPSPFGVVGVCVLVIGLMMLCVLPWTGGGAVAAIDALLGGGLLILGVVLSFGARLVRRTAE
jgi:Na+/proline symporter